MAEIRICRARERSCRMRSAARLPERTALSIVAGRPVAVQSPARTRLRHAVTAAGRRAFCAGVAAKVARRSRTSCHGGSSVGDARNALHILPDHLCNLVPGMFKQTVGIADRHRDTVLEGENPFGNAVDHPDHGRNARRRQPEMRIDDRAVLGPASAARVPGRRRGVRRHRQHDGIFRPDRGDAVAEIESADPVAIDHQPAQLMRERDRRRRGCGERRAPARRRPRSGPGARDRAGTPGRPPRWSRARPRGRDRTTPRGDRC